MVITLENSPQFSIGKLSVKINSGDADSYLSENTKVIVLFKGT
jgi:hypothetical protein